MKKIIPSLVCAAFSFVVGSIAHGQVLYGTDFDGTTMYPFNDMTVYTQNSDIVGQGVPGQVWTGNDDPSVQEGSSTSTVYHSGLNSVVASTLDAGSAGTLQGEILPATPGSNGLTVHPGQTSVYVAHPFTLAGTTALTKGYALDTDFNISPPATTTSTASGYGFGFQTSANANIVSVLFTRDVNNSAKDDVEYQIGTNTIVNPNVLAAINIQSNYHLNLSVNVVANTFSITVSGVPIVTNISLGTLTASSAAEVAALQFIAGGTTTTNSPNAVSDGNGGYTGAGDDQITFDNLSVTVAPEPSTYVMTGLGFIGLIGLMKLRRVA